MNHFFSGILFLLILLIQRTHRSEQLAIQDKLDELLAYWGQNGGRYSEDGQRADSEMCKLHEDIRRSMPQCHDDLLIDDSEESREI